MQSKSEQGTIEYGKKIASDLRGGDVVLLHGDLGSGKTTLVKGIAEGLGVNDDVVSPTFTLMNVYGIMNNELGIMNFVHVDTYRLNNDQELVDIGIEDYLGDKETICVIEWPEKVAGLLKNNKVVNIKVSQTGDSEREIFIIPNS
jgi:tRNA threonylcarbamoyladenosine biosynthesis protein TsaE